MNLEQDSPARPAPPTASGILVLCRPGFEREAAGELQQHAAAAGCPGSVELTAGAAIVVLRLAAPAPVRHLAEAIRLPDLVFARERLFTLAHCHGLPESDRATPLVEALAPLGVLARDLAVSHPDSDAARELSGFCRRFAEPLSRQLERRALLRPRRAELPTLHVVFDTPTSAWLCLQRSGDGAAWPMGIPRLRMPRDAPSRSTLKLAEAFATLLDEPERTAWLKPGMKAVDLGAAPGGWSWQLAQRGLHVSAVDNGPLAPKVRATGLVEHVRADGFTWRPHRPVDWMVCDMVEQPARVAKLAAEWIAQGRCRYAIFNLKLPMKRRLEEIEQCRAIIAGQLKRRGHHLLRIKQLYHDREEVTALLTLLP
jgi:23S rRNA (cytidine2498-2'-O)-methyltransferase